MGKDKIRYLIFINGRWRWRPTRTMRAAGFRLINLSPGDLAADGSPTPSAADKAEAMRLNDDWDRQRRGLPPRAVVEHVPPKGSLAEAYDRVMKMRASERERRGKVPTAEQRSRDDWIRAWRYIEPIFGDCDPKTITPERMAEFRWMISSAKSESEAHRVIKVWRSLWKKMALFPGYCEFDRDPSKAIPNTAPPPRQAVWAEGEAVRLVKAAWRGGYHGLAACLAVAWDSQLSPVDARSLKFGQMRHDRVGVWFALDRAKTGRAAIATLSRRAESLLNAYIALRAGAEPLATTPIFRNRSGRPYSKDTLGDDFRVLRGVLFGPEEDRRIADFRRSGSVEALAGDVDVAKLSAKMANTLSNSNRLHHTYGPTTLAAVRDADGARRRGRAKLRD